MIGSILKGILVLGGTFVGGVLLGVISVKVHQRITARLIALKVREKYSEELENRSELGVLILEKKTNAVNVGIYGPKKEEIGKMNIETDRYSVAEDLYEGQYLTVVYQ